MTTVWDLAADRFQLAAGQALVTDFSAPGDLAVALNRETKQTPALQLIDDALVDVADGRCDRLILSMPPQEGKSERCTHYAPLWALRRNPELRIGIVSFDLGTARRWGQAIRTDIEVFDGRDGNIDLGLRLRPDNRAAGEWKLALPHRGGVYTVGIGGALTGRPIDWLFIDDPVKDYKNADSDKMTETAWNWWTAVARPRLAPGAPVVLILTRWSEKDLAGRLLTKQREDEQAGLEHFDRWRTLTIPAQADHRPELDETDPLGREPGEYMTSARGRTRIQWESIKVASGSRVWNALYQGRPSSADGNIWKRSWWRRYDAPLWTKQPDGTMRLHGMDEVLASWDLTFKDTKGSDFVVGGVWARKGADIYLLDVVRDRMNFVDTLAAFRRFTDRWPDAKAKLVEDKANGPAVIASLRKEIPGIIAVEPKDSKLARASAVAPFIESGNVHLPAAEVALFDVEGFIEEAAAFPTGAHDDQVDMASQALHRLALKPGQGSSFTDAWKRMAAARAAGHPEKPHPPQGDEPCPLCTEPLAAAG